LDLPTLAGTKSQISPPAVSGRSTTTRSRNAPRSHGLRSFHGIFPQLSNDRTPLARFFIKKIASPLAGRDPAGNSPAGPDPTRPDRSGSNNNGRQRLITSSRKPPANPSQVYLSLSRREKENSGAVDHTSRVSRARPRRQGPIARSPPTRPRPAVYLNKSPAFVTPAHTALPRFTY
jgi:hypothetical protein